MRTHGIAPTFLLSGLLLAGSVGQSLCGEQPYKTAAELRKACEPLIGPFKPQLNKTPEDSDEPRLFIVDYLGSREADIRDAAVDILAKLACHGRPIRAGIFEKYLTKSYPLNVRLVAFSFSLANYAAYSSDEAWDKMNAAWASVLKDVAEERVCPANLAILALALERNSYSGKWVEWVPEKSRAILMQRLLSLLSWHDEQVRGKIVRVLWRFPIAKVAEGVVAWYGLESSQEARWAVVDFVADRGDVAAGEDMGAVQAILSIATKDADRTIADRAQQSLERIRSGKISGK